MVEQTIEEIIKEIRQGIAAFGEEFMMQMIDIYLDDAPKRLLELRQAYLSGNRETFTRAAHTLKSSSAYVGAKHFSKLAETVEGASGQGALANLGDQVVRLEEAYQEVKAALEEVRKAL
jgi:HPt (histidine-containing phosphotransfer) domain-containing protein